MLQKSSLPVADFVKPVLALITASIRTRVVSISPGTTGTSRFGRPQAVWDRQSAMGFHFTGHVITKLGK